MKTLTFITNLVNHHQLPLADEFYKILGQNYHYIATEPIYDWLVKGGYDATLDRPYIIRAYESPEKEKLAKELVDNSDVVIIGDAPKKYVRRRQMRNKMTFHFNERWFKNPDFKKYLKIGILGGIFKNHFIYRFSRAYMLCASAFTAEDVKRVWCYPGKCFRWGYFTAVPEKIEVETQKPGVSTSKTAPHIMWCSRFLRLKHPELPVKLAAMLKADGYKFVLDMYGSGEELEATKALAQDLCVDDIVSFCGNMPNKEILAEMRQHQIFLFTSDRGEGWGAVLNESMSNGCAVVASNEIGAVPFLIKDGVNGMIFESRNLQSLYSKVKYLLDNPEQISMLSKEAMRTMQTEWSPQSAAANFISLVDSLESKRENMIKNGPCSSI